MKRDRSRTLRRRIAATASAVLAMSTVFLPAGNVEAGINSGIVFTDASFTHVDQSGNPVTDHQEVWQGDHLQFAVNYDGTNAGVAFGDEFTITLPAFLRLQDTTARRPLTTADGTKAGECSLSNAGTSSTISCVFNGAVRRKTEVKGSIHVTLQVAMLTSTATADVTLSGQPQTVPLPYDKPVTTKPAEPWQPADTPGSQAEQLTSNSKGINWDITTPGDWLNTNHPSGSQVVIKDTITPGTFPTTAADHAHTRVIEECADPRNPNASLSRVVADGVGKSIDGFRLKAETSEQQNTTLAMSGPWNSRCTYHVRLRTTFPDNHTVDKTTTYINTASFEATGTTLTAESRYQDPFTGTVSYREGDKVAPPHGVSETPAASPENA